MTPNLPLGVVLSALTLLLTSGSAAAQLASQLGPDNPARTALVAAGPDYEAGALHRMLFGEHYRDLWTTPIEVRVLDLGRFAGGLKPKEQGGGQQTKSLRLTGADGREYTFRSVDKDPTPALHPTLRGTVANRIAKDGISSAHPGAPPVAAVLLEAAGVLHAEPALRVMPSDPRLGEFASEFAGVLGYIEEHPTDGFGGAAEVVDSDQLIERLLTSPADRVDARNFLTARLVDHLLGDWDRHRDQWRWAGFPRDGGMLWRPIPRDRDQALVRFDGFLPGLARKLNPKLVVFDREYPDLVGLTWNGRDLDRRLLSELDSADFDAVAVSLQAALPDSVIERAVSRMPRAYHERRGAWTARILEARRDLLREHAGRYYRFLAREVNIYGTDAADLVEILREPEGTTIRLRRLGPNLVPGRPHYQRRLDPGETREARLYLGAGDDRIVVRGEGRRLKVRVVGGEGNDTLDALADGGIEFHDDRGSNGVVPSGVVSIDTRPAPWYESPDTGEVETGEVERERPRDWGTSFSARPLAGYHSELGLLLGAGISRKSYGFRREPYASHIYLGAEYAPSGHGFRIELLGEFVRPNPRVRLVTLAQLSQIEVVRFPALGNESPAPPDPDQSPVHQWQLLVGPTLEYEASPHLTVHAGPVLKYTNTEIDPSAVIPTSVQLAPGGFGRIGVQAGLERDTRDTADAPLKGSRARVTASFYPPVWSADRAFGSVEGELSTYLSAGPIPLRPVLALRAGGRRVWGEFPYDEAAFLGGSRSLRGYPYHRFAGAGALYGGAELRLSLGWIGQGFIPTEVGIFGLADGGRVFADGEESDRWHRGFGGGLALSILSRRNTFSIAIADGEEGTRHHLRVGFAF